MLLHECVPVTIRMILIFFAVAMAPGLRAQDANQQATSAAGTQPAPFAAPINKADLDLAAFTQWVDGVEGSAPTWGDKPFDPVRLFWTREASQDYVGGWSFGGGANLGPRHLRVGFHKAVPLGTILAAGNCSVSVLAPQATYPGDLADDAQWIPAERIAGNAVTARQGGIVWTLPRVTETRAIRFTHMPDATDTAYAGTLAGVALVSERYANVAPQAVIAASANDNKADSIADERLNTWVCWDNWSDAKPPLPVADRAPWLLLSWSEPRTIRGLATVFSGFSSADFEVYTGPADRHPAEASDADWKIVKQFDGIQNWYPLGLPVAWLDPGDSFKTRAVRLRMTKASPGGHPHVADNHRNGRRVWLDELIVLEPLGTAALASMLPSRRATDSHPPIPIRFTLAQPSQVTLVIDDAQGKRVRNLVSETPFPAGDNVAWWDGMDDLARDLDAAKHGLYHVPGQFVPPGTYSVRGLVSKGIDLEYEFPIYTAGSPAWNTADHTGAWLSNHSSPSCALFVPADRSPTGKDLVYLGSHVSEGTHGLVWVDLEGRKVGGAVWVGGIWTGAQELALDTGSRADPATVLYVGASFDGELRLTAITRGNAGTTKEKSVYKQGKKEDGATNNISGLAARDGLLVCSLANAGKLLFIEVATGKLLGEAAMAEPRGLAFDASGRLLVLSEKRLLRFTLGAEPAPHLFAAPEVVVATGLDEPARLAIGPDGSLFVSDRGRSHQVKVFAASGAPVRTIGTPGAPQAGPYEPRHMNNPAGLTVDSQGRIWVTEEDRHPKRVSVWSADGELVKAFYGPAEYGGGGMLDPQDPTVFYYDGMQFTLDWEKGADTLTAVLWRKEMNAGLLPDGHFADGAPEYPLYAEGNKYLTNCFKTNPTSGASVATLWVVKDSRVRPVAAVGDARGWSLLKREAFKSRWPQGVDPAGDYHRNPAFCIWSDRNDDGVPQPEEVAIVAGDTGGITFLPDLSFVASRRGGKTVRFTPASYSSGGAPFYEIAGGEILATDVQHPASSGGDQALWHPDGWTAMTAIPKPFSPFSVAGVYKGEPKWSYPNLWPGLHASHEAAVPDQPGMLIGTTRLLGGFVTPRNSDAGPLWCVNGNMGNMFLFTTDGLFVAELFKDSRVGASWAMPRAIRGMRLNDVSNSTENFFPTISQTADGDVFLCDGSRTSLVRVKGLETIRRLPDQRLQVTDAELAKSREYFSGLEAARQAASGTKRLRVTSLAAPPAIDGSLAEWQSADWASVEKRGAGANFNSNSKPYEVEAAVAVAGDQLVVAFRTADKNLLRNSGETPNALFKTGGALDVMLGTDPAADPKRTKPVPGDVRLLVTQVNGKTAATLYRAVVPGTAAQNRVPFSSPWRTIHFDVVEDVSDIVKLAQVDGDYELAVPLKLVGLAPAAGYRIKADVGILRGDGFQTRQRVYWSNKATGLLADVPGEAELTPGLWGEWEFVPAK